MELQNINKDICEQMPLLVSGVMSLKGVALHPKQIEFLLEKNRFDGLNLDTILDVSNYSSAIEFIGACKEQKYKILSGNLVIALTNFLLRRIAVKESFIREGIDPMTAAAELNDIFAKQQGKSLCDFLRIMFEDLENLKLLAHDNEALIYLIVNFYLYTYMNQTLVYATESDRAAERFIELKLWVKTWRG